jgi:hypothetical protein
VKCDKILTLHKDNTGLDWTSLEDSFCRLIPIKFFEGNPEAVDRRFAKNDFCRFLNLKKSIMKMIKQPGRKLG